MLVSGPLWSTGIPFLWALFPLLSVNQVDHEVKALYWEYWGSKQVYGFSIFWENACLLCEYIGLYLCSHSTQIHCVWMCVCVFVCLLDCVCKGVCVCYIVSFRLDPCLSSSPQGVSVCSSFRIALLLHHCSSVVGIWQGGGGLCWLCTITELMKQRHTSTYSPIKQP